MNIYTSISLHGTYLGLLFRNLIDNVIICVST